MKLIWHSRVTRKNILCQCLELIKFLLCFFQYLTLVILMQKNLEFFRIASSITSVSGLYKTLENVVIIFHAVHWE